MFMLCSMFIQMFVRRGGVECRGTVSWLWRSSVFCCYSVSAGSVVSLSSSLYVIHHLTRLLIGSPPNIHNQYNQPDEVLSNDCVCMFSCCLSFFGSLPSACQNQLYICLRTFPMCCVYALNRLTTKTIKIFYVYALTLFSSRKFHRKELLPIDGDLSITVNID